MQSYHDEIEIEDMEQNEDDEMYYYPCPCGDLFQISYDAIKNGDDIATCPSCDLKIKIIF